ncbi:extracellular solute-binding protein [Paenibacillus sp. GCM10027626]|uniref:extracellular solute-binding protein n=1 Tax=Paenibacillus sp. GCM10027626 TaxID=3273411 RepID=UPI0036293490
MNRKRVQTLLLAVVLALTAALAACSQNGTDGGNSGKKTGEQTDDSGQTKSDTGVKMESGPLGKYDPPIELTTVRSVNAGVQFQGDDSYDSNIWTKDYESVLGIKVKNKWKVSDQQYQNKMTVTIVSGDTPDFMLVDAQQFQTLVQAEQLLDLTSLFDEYATDLTKSSLDEAGGVKRQAGTVGGKLYGIAADGGGRDDAHLLYIRQDWLDNLKLEPPKTMDDVIKIAIAFTKDDPDQDGQNNTYGLALEKNLFGGWAALNGFMNGYHAYPYNPGNGNGTSLVFMKGADGKPVWADAQPEVKTALGKLSELFKAGVIYPEFSVIDGVKAGELATSGKVGMTFGSFYVPTWPINNMKKENPKVEWGIYPIVSADGEAAKALSTSVVPTKFYVISKKSKHPEAVIKLLNYTNEKLHGESRDIKYHTVKDANGNSLSVHMYPPISGTFADKNQSYFYQLQDALDKKDPSGLDEEAKLYYDQVMQYRSGDWTVWFAGKLWDKGGVFDRLGEYKKEERIVVTSYLGAPTPTMLSKGTALRDLEVKTFTEIIMGAKPLDYFDEFVKQWHEQGGQQILDEVDAMSGGGASQ